MSPCKMPLEEFRSFYRSHLKLEEADFEKFMAAMESRLPSTFRITPTQHTEKIRERFEEYDFLEKVAFLQDVYTFDLKAGHPKEFMEFLVAQTDIGNIQRQEVVSLLPHMFLQVEGSHYVLETCASPGSKTKNLLESIKDGLLISNDRSTSRVNILVSESMKKATQNFIITAMDASSIPNMSIKFDRICCDVPCSSDGTCRKNPSLMPKWSPRGGIGLSSLQLRILKRSLDHLKVGGRLVYSTCSMNPIEDEWVVNGAIKDNPEFELMDDFGFVQYASESSESNLKVTLRKGLTEFSYEGFEFNNLELSKCFRILPHDQNTGGFFLAVIRRVSEKAKSTANVPTKGALNSKFVDIDKATKEKIAGDYTVPFGVNLISFNANFKKIFAVSDLAYEVLCSNPKMKPAYAGIPAFVEYDLDKTKYRAKSPFLESADMSTDFTVSLDDFKKLLVEAHVPASELEVSPRGLFSCTVEGTGLKFCGFSGGNKVFLYIDDNHRKAYRQLYGDLSK